MNLAKLLTAFSFSFLIFLGCQSEPKYFLDKPKEVVITGQVVNRLHYQPKSIAIIINDVASGEQLRVVDDVDDQGRFECRFERFYPQEVMLKYETIFSVFVHPGDSIHIKLDGEKLSTEEGQYQAISFSGNAAKENEQINKFQKWFFPIRMKKSMSQVEESRFGPERYSQFRDSLRKSYHQYRVKFANENKVSAIVDSWIFYQIELDFFHNLTFYPSSHKSLNKLPQSWKISEGYYDFYKNIKLPLESLYNAQFTRDFVQNYFSFYILPKIQNDIKNPGPNDTLFQKAKTAHNISVTIDAYVDGIKKYSPEGLFRQLVLNWFFNINLKSSMKIDLFEKYLTTISTEINEPFLKVPLLEKYRELKEIASNPINQKNALFKNSENTPGANILKEILAANKGKVIYIDCWATWCGPCIAEMPYSRKLMSDLKGEEVEFVYLNFQSPKDAAQKEVIELNLGGTHYFLDDDQSNHLQKTLAVSGFPTYILIDKKGQITKSGSMYSPRDEKTKNEILKLINQD
jgi:thiol-disulfide isomerase/thioredoxin